MCICDDYSEFVPSRVGKLIGSIQDVCLVLLEQQSLRRKSYGIFVETRGVRRDDLGESLVIDDGRDSCSDERRGQ